MKKRTTGLGRDLVMKIDMPDEITAHLTKECKRNMHGCNVVGLTSESFEKASRRANMYSGASEN
jgi:hypothetical protein